MCLFTVCLPFLEYAFPEGIGYHALFTAVSLEPRTVPGVW